MVLVEFEGVVERQPTIGPRLGGRSCLTTPGRSSADGSGTVISSGRMLSSSVPDTLSLLLSGWNRAFVVLPPVWVLAISQGGGERGEQVRPSSSSTHELDSQQRPSPLVLTRTRSSSAVAHHAREYTWILCDLVQLGFSCVGCGCRCAS